MYIFFILITFLFGTEKQIYTAVQMMDQVMTIDAETLQIEGSILTEFNNENMNSDCMEYITEMECVMSSCMWMEDHCMSMDDSCMDNTDEMSCNMNNDCEWMMGMCMESENSCMDNPDEMSCNMTNGCEWMMGMCMENIDQQGINTPHFIVLDETNGYWFVTTIASGFIAQFSLLDDTLIDSYFVGDAPALLAIDISNKKIYCSRMMPMSGMGNMMPSSDSNIVESLNYSAMGLSPNNQEYQINSPAPHGLAINNDGTELYTASNTADWLYKINTITGEIVGVPMDENVGNPPDQVTQRLKPIQCLSLDGRLFVTCSSGIWMNPFTGEQSIIQGQLQLWNSDTMVLIDSIDLGEHSAPWHIKESPIDDVVYVALAGDNLYDTEGVACVRFENDILTLDWLNTHSSFDTFHGIDVSDDGQKIYVSSRGGGKIHVFNSNGNYEENVFLGSMAMLGGIALEKKGTPLLGDANNDTEYNVVDIVLIVNSIFNPMLSSPYQLYASDYNEDDLINVVDIVLVVELIMSLE